MIASPGKRAKCAKNGSKKKGALCEALRKTDGFPYLVSLTGVTGSRRELPTELVEFVGKARQASRTPLAVEFGVSTPQ